MVSDGKATFVFLKHVVIKKCMFQSIVKTDKAAWSRHLWRHLLSVQHGEIIYIKLHTPPLLPTGSNLAVMPIGHQFTGSTPLQIAPQPSLHPILLDTVLVQAIINPKRGMEGSLQPQTPSPKTCGSPGAAGASCRSLDVRVAVLLLSLAGALILLLLYRLLQLRHRCVCTSQRKT